MNCILIDDDKDDIDIFKFAVEDLNLNIYVNGFTNFEEALNFLVINELPDYIFLDGFMNVTSGKEVLKKIKSINQLSHIPIIIYSGFVSQEQASEFMELGAHRIILKSNTINELRSTLTELFKEKSSPINPKSN